MTPWYVKAYRRYKEKRYKGELSVEITCPIRTGYGIACPKCWHDITPDNDCAMCQESSGGFLQKAGEVAEVFEIPIENLTPVHRPVFAP